MNFVVDLQPRPLLLAKLLVACHHLGYKFQLLFILHSAQNEESLPQAMSLALGLIHLVWTSIIVFLHNLSFFFFNN